jgi:2-oxo-4-hydroxy-4-carboxy-5-ureidoimidazoline decarboxylase
MVTLDEINALDRAAFVRLLGGIYEHSPWVADRAYERGPFLSFDALAEALQDVVLYAPRDEQLALIRAHPELAGKAAIAGQMTAHSQSEQAGAGLNACSPAEFAKLQQLNAAYGAKFGFPFVLAVKGHTRASIIAAFEQRLGNDRDSEIAEAVRQIGRIARFRLEALVA